MLRDAIFTETDGLIFQTCQQIWVVKNPLLHAFPPVRPSLLGAAAQNGQPKALGFLLDLYAGMFSLLRKVHITMNKKITQHFHSFSSATSVELREDVNLKDHSGMSAMVKGVWSMLEVVREAQKENEEEVSFIWLFYLTYLS